MASGEKLYPNPLTVTPPADFANSVSFCATPIVPHFPLTRPCNDAPVIPLDGARGLRPGVYATAFHTLACSARIKTELSLYI